MYISTLELNGKKYKGTLDFFVLKDIQDDLSKIDIKTTIPNIFQSISELKMEYISSFILKSICRIDEISEEEFLKDYLSYENDEEILQNFNSIFIYINDLMSKCLYKTQKVKKENDIFEDEEEFDSQDWDISNIEYTWNSVLNRQENILNITPKNYFEQIEIYKKVNKIKDEEVEEM